MLSNQTHLLGRDKDPWVPNDLSRFQLKARKTLWEALGLVGARRAVSLLYPSDTVCFFDAAKHPGVEGYVAFTIDDGIVGMDNLGGEMVVELREVLAKHNAKATLFCTAKHFLQVNPEQVLGLVKDGHELANHGTEDRPYHLESREEFAADLDATDRVIERYQEKKLPWYRAPHARYSKAMRAELESRKMTHVVVDCFANDTAIPDPTWIANFMLKHVTDGSVSLIHMPERGMREWNLKAMDLFLAGLAERNLKAVTFSELHARAHGTYGSSDDE